MTAPQQPDEMSRTEWVAGLAHAGQIRTWREAENLLPAAPSAQPDEVLVGSGWHGADPCGGPACFHPHDNTPAQPVRDTEETP